MNRRDDLVCSLRFGLITALVTAFIALVLLP